MISITDGIILLMLLISFWSGWQKGLLRIILGPLSLLAGTVASYLYYSCTHNFLISVLIGLLGPIVLNFTLTVGLAVWNKTVNNNQKANILSRAGGGILNLLWTAGLSALVLVLLAILPSHFFGLDKIRADLDRSIAYSLVQQFIQDKVPSQKRMDNMLNIFDPAQLKNIEDTKEYKNVMEDKKVQAILSNEETMKQIQRKDFAKLLSNPEFLKIFQDDHLMKNILDLNMRLLKAGSGGETSGPKVYEPVK